MTNELPNDNELRIAAIDSIINAFMRDFARIPLIIAIASHDSLSDFIDAQIDDSFAIITENDDFINNAFNHIRDDDFAIRALHSLMTAAIYDRIIA